MYCAYVCCIHIICSAVYMGGMKPWPCIIGPVIMVAGMPAIIAGTDPAIMAAVVPGIPGYISGFSNEYWCPDVITELQ